MNGRAIRVEQVERGHDLLTAGEVSAASPSVARLRREYGLVLGGLIVQELTRQELERRGLTVDAADLQAAERAIRADYPGGAFERLLMEEAVGLDLWRERLRSRLEAQVFAERVLGPQSSVDAAEAEAYVQANPQEFMRPARAVFLLIRAPDRETLNRAGEAFRKGEAREAIAARFAGVELRELALREDRLPEGWRRAVREIGPGEASAILTETGALSRLVLLSRQDAEPLPPQEAQALALRLLRERRRAQSYAAWLDGALSAADIRVNAALLRPGSAEEAQKAGEATADKPGVDAAKPAPAGPEALRPEVLMRDEEAAPLPAPTPGN